MWHDLGTGRSMRLIISHYPIHTAVSMHAQMFTLLKGPNIFLSTFELEKREMTQRKRSVSWQHTVFNVSLSIFLLFLMYGGKVFRAKKV